MSELFKKQHIYKSLYKCFVSGGQEGLLKTMHLSNSESYTCEAIFSSLLGTNLKDLVYFFP